MPTTIPYDPSLLLGNVVHQDDVDAVIKDSENSEPVREAQDALNGFILAKRKLDMTVTEIEAMGIKAGDDLSKEMANLDEQLPKAAAAYASAVIASTKKMSKATAKQGKVSKMPESPIDWEKSAIKMLALSSDTMNMDAQFIRNEDEDDGSEAHSNAVSLVVNSSVNSLFGAKVGASAATAAKKATLASTSLHNIVGTLVITATCTHKTADVFAPFVLDPEKGVDAWNSLFPDEQIDTDNVASMQAAISDSEKDIQGGKVINLLSGQTTGSSFVGMVHVERHETEASSQISNSNSKKAQTEMQWGGFFASASGAIGVDKEFSNNVKNMLSTSSLSSHCSLITMGVIPSIKSNSVGTSIAQLKPSASEVMGQLASIQGATDNNVNSSIAGVANEGKTAKQFTELNNSYLTTVVSDLSESATVQNSIINVNSLMTAFDDYVAKVSGGGIQGVPINFMLKEITRGAIVKSWLKKFSPLTPWNVGKEDENKKD